MSSLSEQQRQELLANPAGPVPVVDEQAGKTYYLISSEQYEAVRAFLNATEFDPREAYPQIAKTAAEAGWADPLMDDYDRYDELRREG